MKRKKIIVIIGFSFCLSSCNLYKSTSINSPLLNGKGDTQLKLSTLSSFEFSAIYALTNKVALIADAGNTGTYSVRYKTENDVYKNDAFVNYKLDAALGLYNAAKNKKGFQVFTGYSYGRAGTLANSFLKAGTNSMLNTKFSGPYFQTSYRIKIKENSFVNLMSKSNYYRFYDFKNIGNYETRGLADGDEFFIQQFGIEFKQTRQKVTTNAQLLYADYYGAANNFTVRGFSVHFGVAYSFFKRR
jgi:hypothetical protein